MRTIRSRTTCTLPLFHVESLRYSNCPRDALGICQLVTAHMEREPGSFPVTLRN